MRTITLAEPLTCFSAVVRIDIYPGTLVYVGDFLGLMRPRTITEGMHNA